MAFCTGSLILTLPARSWPKFLRGATTASHARREEHGFRGAQQCRRLGRERALGPSCKRGRVRWERVDWAGTCTVALRVERASSLPTRPILAHFMLGVSPGASGSAAGAAPWPRGCCCCCCCCCCSTSWRWFRRIRSAFSAAVSFPCTSRGLSTATTTSISNRIPREPDRRRRPPTLPRVPRQRLAGWGNSQSPQRGRLATMSPPRGSSIGMSAAAVRKGKKN